MKREYRATRYAVLLAGGQGRRLWPISRLQRPKQMVRQGVGTLLEHTLQRIARLVVPDHQLIVTTQTYEQQIRTAVGQRKILVEPISRNTAPAFLLSAQHIAKLDPEAIILFLPADHIIQDIDGFEATIERMYEYAAMNDQIVLAGITPTYPATTYGYIESAIAADSGEMHQVRKFHEKPSFEVAKGYCEAGSYWWNSGIVCARVSVILDEFARHAPDIIANSNQYELLPSRSFDHAILEHSARCVITPADFDWEDVGSLSRFFGANKDALGAAVSMMGAQGNVAYSLKKTVFVGVESLCLIETDDMLVVMPKVMMDRTDLITEQLQRLGLEEYL